MSQQDDISTVSENNLVTNGMTVIHTSLTSATVLRAWMPSEHREILNVQLASARKAAQLHGVIQQSVKPLGHYPEMGWGGLRW